MNKRNFTLTELLIAIAIIGVLATMITVASKHAVNKAQVAKCHVQMNALEVALEQFYQTYHKWPFDAASGLRHDTKVVNSKSEDMNFYLDNNASGTGWANGKSCYERMVCVLQAEDDGNVNVRKKSYLPTQNNQTGVYKDPWGNEYRIYVSPKHSGKIVIDADNSSDKKCVPGLSVDPIGEGTGPKKVVIHKNILIVSQGMDGKWNTSNDGIKDDDNEDNVYSVSTRWVDGIGHEITD